MKRGPRRLARRLGDWWERRRGKRSRVLDLLAGQDDDDAGSGVREPRRPLVPSLSGSVALDEPDDDGPA
jgi:hypothetical protein